MINELQKLNTQHDDYNNENCSTNNKNPEKDIGVQPKITEKQSSQTTREVFALPRLGNQRLAD